MKTFTFDESGLSELANQVKDALRDVTKITALDGYIVVVAAPSFFGQIKQKLFLNPEDKGIRITILKVP